MASKKFLWVLPLVFLACEYVAFSLLPHRWFTLHIFRGAAASFTLALLFFGRRYFLPLRSKVELHGRAAVFHIAALVGFYALTLYLNLLPRGRVFSSAPAAATLWLALVPILLITCLASFLKLRVMAATIRNLGPAWIYASVCAVSVAILRERLQDSWDSSSTALVRFLQAAAFNESHWVLHFFYPVVVADSSTHILGTSGFLVEVAGSCSGLEGLALMSVFLLLWLIFERRKLRIARALLLVPFALALMWSLNVLRLVALIAIGTAGHPDIAINGFHAQAGWICFNGVALGVLLAAQHVAWFQKHAAGVSGAETHENAALDLRGTRNPTAVYLAPFLSIIVASLITQSISSGFEWLYPLRFVGAAGVLLYFRDDYQRLNWRCGWLGTAAGLAVALLWLGAHYATSLTPAGMSQSPFVSGLTALSPLQRFLWITFRLLAAVVTVPIAEELCFRGFLARRLVSLDFEVVPFYILGATQILLSAAVFGLMHGRSWFAGILAGVAFAWVAKRSGRLGEAVGAHMVANLAIAVVVLVSKDYTLWS